MSDRAQTVTLEAVVASLLIIAAVAFALQAVAISSNTADVGDAETRAQHSGIAQGILDRAAENGQLRTTIVYWDEERQEFLGEPDEDGFFRGTTPNTTFGAALESLEQQHRTVNVRLTYLNETGELASQPLVESGTPPTDAIRVSRTVTLYEDTPLVDKNESARENATLAVVEEDFFAPNAAPDDHIYNVIRVEVVIW